MPEATTFKLFTNAALTTPLTGNLSSQHNVDGTSAAAQHTIYFGSLGSAGGNTADRKAQANSNPGVDNLTASIVYKHPVWAASTAKLVNDIVRPTVANGWKFQAQGAGTTGATQPTWPLTINATVVDGTVTWKNIGHILDLTDLKLAATQAGLATATAGAALSLGVTVTSASANAKPIWAEVVAAPDTLIALYDDLKIETNQWRETPV